MSVRIAALRLGETAIAKQVHLGALAAPVSCVGKGRILWVTPDSGCRLPGFRPARAGAMLGCRRLPITVRARPTFLRGSSGRLTGARG